MSLLPIASPFTSTPSVLKRNTGIFAGTAFATSGGGNKGLAKSGFAHLPFPVDESEDNGAHYGSGSTDTNGACNYTYALDTRNRPVNLQDVGPWEALVMRRIPTDAMQCAHQAMSISVFNLKMAQEEWRRQFGILTEGSKIKEVFDLGRIVQHTLVEDWQKNGDAQYITTHIFKRAPIFNYWSLTYDSMWRTKERATVNEGDYLWWILRRFEFTTETLNHQGLDPSNPKKGAAVPAGSEYFWQLVPFVKSWAGAPSPMYYCDRESTGEAIYVGRVLEAHVNGWSDKEDVNVAREAVFPRELRRGYKDSLMKLSKLVVMLGI